MFPICCYISQALTSCINELICTVLIISAVVWIQQLMDEINENLGTSEPLFLPQEKNSSGNWFSIANGTVLTLSKSIQEITAIFTVHATEERSSFPQSLLVLHNTRFSQLSVKSRTLKNCMRLSWILPYVC